MGEALVSGLLKKEVAQTGDIVVSDISAARRDYLKVNYGLMALDDNRGAVEGSDLVVLAVKPQQAKDVFQDLRGQIIAVSRLKAVSDVAARLAVQRFGLQPDVDVFTRGTGGNAESLAALEAGTVAAASLSVPAVFEARKRGHHDLIDVTAMRIPFGNGTLGATKATLDRRLDVAERVLRAVAQATSRLKTDREYAAQIIGKYSQIEDPEALRGTVDVYAPIMTVDPYPDPAAIQTLLDIEEHPAARTARPEQMIDYRAAEALRRSGFLDRLPKD